MDEKSLENHTRPCHSVGRRGRSLVSNGMHGFLRRACACICEAPYTANLNSDSGISGYGDEMSNGSDDDSSSTSGDEKDMS